MKIPNEIPHIVTRNQFRERFKTFLKIGYIKAAFHQSL